MYPEVIWMIRIQVTFSKERILEERRMPDSQSNAPRTQAPSSGMRGEIQQRWGKFSAQEISALKDKDDLVAQIQAKYAVDKAQAQRDVDAFAKGRQL
jgi:hypothetical protein